MFAIVVAVLTLSVLHALLGVLSICLGIAASVQADVWMAHSVSPIWSGVFFAVTGMLGFACAKRKTAYMIMCFTAFSIVSLVTAVVSIQLLRLGLVNQTSDGNTYEKEEKDSIIVAALVVTSIECLVCIISSFVSCRMAKAAKKAMERKRDGTFQVQDMTENEDCRNNNLCVIYTVGKGYHNSVLRGVTSENGSAHTTQLPCDVRRYDDFTDIASIQVPSDSLFNIPQDDLNSSLNASLSDTGVATNMEAPFKSYDVNPENEYLTPKATRGDTKTVTFCESNQIVHLSPARSYDSSPSVVTPEEERKTRTALPAIKTDETFVKQSTKANQKAPPEVKTSSAIKDPDGEKCDSFDEQKETQSNQSDGRLFEAESSESASNPSSFMMETKQKRKTNLNDLALQNISSDSQY